MDVDNPVALREMVRADVPHAHELSQAVGWGHRAEDWQLMFDVGKGIVAIAPDESLRGVAMWWPYGAGFATIGMVIVSPNQQRSGMGRRLMEAILSAAGERRLSLNATSEGLKLYESLGFAATGDICTHYGTVGSIVPKAPSDVQIKELQPQDWPAILRLDKEASGMERTKLLTALSNLSRGLVAESNGRVIGFLLPRRFQKGTLLGPLVADTEGTAMALAAAALALAEGLVRIDIPRDAKDLAHWLHEAGLPKVGQVTTMWRPAPPSTDQGMRIFGLSSQALG